MVNTNKYGFYSWYVVYYFFSYFYMIDPSFLFLWLHARLWYGVRRYDIVCYDMINQFTVYHVGDILHIKIGFLSNNVFSPFFDLSKQPLSYKTLF